MLAKGLDVHDLALDARRPALLGAMDRLLAVSRSAPGATALFPGHGGGGEALPEDALREACALCRSRPHDSGKDETEGVRKLGACSSRRGCDAPLAEHAGRQSAASC